MKINKSDYKIVKDINGKCVAVSLAELCEGFGGTIFGLSFDVILELRKEYRMRGGKWPVTKEDVKNIFNRNGE
jgi:hypothetical protein